MANELDTGNDIGFLAAAADYQTTSKQFYIMSAENGVATLASSAGQKVIGVLQNDPAAGQPARVRTGGVSKIIVGSGGVTANDALQTDASGQAITAASGDFIVGFALETAAAGAYVTALIAPGAQVN